jgi:glycosyltransferase involved in cell wall biosynthesis
VAPNDEQAAVDALHQLLENDALRTQLGAQAAHLATTQLTWAENARNITRVFEQCIREHGR